MKQIKMIEEVQDGLEALLGENVLLMCGCYFYTGKLVGVNDTCVKLDACRLVYETGPWDGKAFKDAQLIGDGHYVMMQAIESFRVTAW